MMRRVRTIMMVGDGGSGDQKAKMRMIVPRRDDVPRRSLLSLNLLLFNYQRPKTTVGF